MTAPVAQADCTLFGQWFGVSGPGAGGSATQQNCYDNGGGMRQTSPPNALFAQPVDLAMSLEATDTTLQAGESVGVSMVFIVGDGIDGTQSMIDLSGTAQDMAITGTWECSDGQMPCGGMTGTFTASKVQP